MSSPITDELSPQETFRAFAHRERATVTAASIAFAALMLYMIFSVDPAYYYPRLITDQLLYLLKGLWFVHHGTTDARAAVNVEPFVYAAGPGLLRTTWLALFADFDDQIRAIQVSNAVIAGLLATLFAYVVSEVLPQSLHKAAIAFSFLTQILNPVWMTNMLSPLADLPFAAASTATIVLVRDLIAGSDRERNSRTKKILCALFFAAAFLCRFTALAILAYGLVLHRKRNPTNAGRKLITPRVMIAAAVVTVLLIANTHTIVSGYLGQPLVFLSRSPPSGILLNLLGVSIPGAIVPGVEFLYRLPPVQNPFHPQFAANGFDTIVLLLGLCCTAVVGIGMWSARKSRTAQLAYVLVPLPVLAITIPSATRYMLTYQPFIWSFFFIGLAAVRSRLAPSSRITRRAVLGVSCLAILACVSMLYVRSGRLTGTRVTASSFSLGETRRHAGEVATTYRSLRNFLERLPRSRTLVVNARHGTGQWTAIAGVRHFQLDSSATSAAAQNDIYLIVDCATPSTCSTFESTTAAEQRRFMRFGHFDFEKVFDTSTRWSAARVYRVRGSG